MTSEYVGVLVGVDGSACGLEAVRWAAADVAGRSGPLTIATVVDLPRLADVPLSPELMAAAVRAGRETVSAAATLARRVAPGIEVLDRLSTGSPAAELLRMAVDARQVVLGSHGHGAFASLMLGSVAGQVAAHAPVPVVVVRGTVVPGGRVVVGVDGSARSEAALEYALDHADRHGLSVQVIGAFVSVGEVVPVVPYPMPAQLLAAGVAEARSAVDRRTAEAVERWSAKYPKVEVTRTVAEGAAARVLIAAGEGAGLIVVGSRGHGGFAGLVLGSVSQAVVRHARCPVAVVH